MKKYINTVSAFQFFQLIRYSTLILTGIVFTKTALTQTEIGEYETFTFIAGAVSFFWLNGLQKALLPISGEEGKTTIFSAFVILQLLSIFAALFLFSFQPFFSGYLLNGKIIPEIKLLLAYLIISAPAGLVEYFYLVKKWNNAIIVYSVVSFAVQFVLVALPAILGYPVQMVLKGLVASAVFRYIWLIIILGINKEFYFSIAITKKLLILGGPLVAATFLSGSAQFVDGFIVTSKFDENTFAIFRYGARELPLAMLLANALSSAMLPAFSNPDQLTENLYQLKKSVTRLMHILFPLTAILLIISPPLFPVLFNPDFAESATIFNIYLLLVISRLLMPQTMLNGLQISKPIMNAAFFELAINVALSLILVQFYGISGVAFATFIAYLFEKIYLIFVVKRRLKIPLNSYVPLKSYLIYSSGVLIIFIITILIYR